jgi:hypothetical protein
MLESAFTYNLKYAISIQLHSKDIGKHEYFMNFCQPSF